MPRNPNLTFKLKDSFIEKYKTIKPPFGFNGLGEFTNLRTYSRIKENGTNERWWEICLRVVEGTFRKQEEHIKSLNLGWNEIRAQRSAQDMYDRMFNFKWLPPGRGLWVMGTDLIEERGMWAAANNCGFVSTADLDKNPTEPFTFLMDGSMLGVGIGFDTKGAGKIDISAPMYVTPYASPMNDSERIPGQYFNGIWVIPDTREGWVESVKRLLMTYFTEFQPELYFDYSLIRAKGEPIKGFGGTSSGPEPLIQLHDNIRSVLDPLDGKPITERAIADIMNMIGVCVVAGNVRRTAEIMFGSPDSEEYLNLKNYQWDTATASYKGPSADRAGFGWTSNNSIFAELGMDYLPIAKMTAVNGEPGYAWLDNMRRFGRMIDPPNDKDKRVAGGNPCLEQSLESFELCCLVETFPANHDSLEDYKATLKMAYLYAKTITLGKTHWPKTNKVMLRNRRIGTSMSGIQQFVAKHGLDTFKTWCEEGYQSIQNYDNRYSEWLAVPKSVKTTSVKPSGTVSLLAGATPGMHWPESRYYIRRVRVAKTSPLVQRLKDANYTVEDTVGDSSTMVVEFPIALGEDIRTVDEVSIWEQFEMAAFLQRYWADNQVSCTVTFDPKKVDANEIARVLTHYQYVLKGISLLPKVDAGAYAQMPYEGITKEEFEARTAVLLPLNLEQLSEEAEQEKFCNNDTCVITYNV